MYETDHSDELNIWHYHAVYIYEIHDLELNMPAHATCLRVTTVGDLDMDDLNRDRDSDCGPRASASA